MSKAVPYLELAIPLILASGGKKIRLEFTNGEPLEGYAVSINIFQRSITMKIDGEEQSFPLAGLNSVIVFQNEE